MGKIKDIIETIKEKGLKQIAFIGMAVILLAVALWVIIGNFVFIADNLNRAFNPTPIEKDKQVTFDIEGFKNLDLIR